MSEKQTVIDTAANPARTEDSAPACGPGCACSGGGTGRARWLLGALILVVAAVLVVRAVTKSSATAASTSAASATAFAAPASAEATAAPEPAAAAPASTPSPAAAVAVEPAAPGAAPSPAAVAPAAETAAAPVPATTAAAPAGTPPPAAGSQTAVVGTEIEGIAELNKLARDTTAVFLFVPPRQATDAVPPKAPMEAAARTISAQGAKVGLFTLKVGTPDYEQIGTQVAAPGVLALVKGRGMNAVSGEITETKLVQAYVAASSAGGGCCGVGAPASSCK